MLPLASASSAMRPRLRYELRAGLDSAGLSAGSVRGLRTGSSTFPPGSPGTPAESPGSRGREGIWGGGPGFRGVPTGGVGSGLLNELPYVGRRYAYAYREYAFEPQPNTSLPYPPNPYPPNPYHGS